MILFVLTYWASQWIDNIIPTVDLSALSGSIESILVYVRFGIYFLPVHTLTTLFLILNFMLAYSIAVNVLRVIWDVLPFA